jgi:hypothetical protein
VLRGTTLERLALLNCRIVHPAKRARTARCVPLGKDPWWSRRIAVIPILIVLTLTARVAWAQRVEASFSVGYSASEGITADQRPLLGQLYDTLAVDSGASVNFTFGVLVTEQADVEFLWARQNSRLQADGDAGQLPLSELVVYNYMGNFVYNWGSRDAKGRPFFFGGIGATNYSFGDNAAGGINRPDRRGNTLSLPTGAEERSSTSHRKSEPR